MGNNRAKNDELARVLAMIAGLQLHQSGQTIVLDGVSYTVANIIAALQAYLALLNAATAAHAAWLAAVRTRDTTDTTEATPLMSGLGRYLESTYGPESSVLSDYGLKPSKPAKRTLKSKVTAAEKDAATRIARDTMGPRQKAAIHGTIPAETVPPEPAPASNPVAPQATAPGTPPKR